MILQAHDVVYPMRIFFYDLEYHVFFGTENLVKNKMMMIIIIKI